MIAQTGTIAIYNKDNAGGAGGDFGGIPTDTLSITVPADCTVIVLTVSAFSSTQSHLDANGVFSIGANTSVGIASGTAHWRSAIHYIVNPPTGAQTLTWAWGGGAGAAMDETEVILAVSYWSGIDTASPVRDSDVADVAADNVVTPMLTAQASDLIIACGGSFDNANGNLTFTWSGATELQACVAHAYCDHSIATVSPSGNQTVGYTATGAEEISVAAIVFKSLTGEVPVPQKQPAQRPFNMAVGRR